MITLRETTIIPTALPRDQVSAERRAAMFALLDGHFAGVTPAQFAADLAGKSHVILLEGDGRLVGFSTLLIYETFHRGEPVTVVYSGDTIVAPEAWQSPVLARAWIATVNDLRREFSRGRFYWLLLTSGFRTYRFLPVFWREFFPTFDRPTPTATQALMDQLAREKFGDTYDPVRGVVRFPRPQCLRPALAALPPGRESDPHVAFFLARNPGHLQGDELVCVTELTAANLTPAGRRMVARAPA
ncbi:MAG TPA: hypothetical protein VG734_08805 [Lacunisphaera sp.]|nr:hypothetical protein [Lacunisphaera sp.]